MPENREFKGPPKLGVGEGKDRTVSGKEIGSNPYPAGQNKPCDIGKIHVPGQLIDPELGFLLVKPHGKEPIEKGWNDHLYSIDNQNLQFHLENGGNYGISPRTGKMCIVDADTQEVQEALEKLPETFRYSSGKEGHFQYIYALDEPIRNIPLKNGAYIKGLGGYAVGPGSIHPNGRCYGLKIRDIPLAHVNKSELLKALENFILAKHELHGTAKPDLHEISQEEIEKTTTGLMDVWSKADGVRHELSLSIIGYHKKQGWPEKAIKQVVDNLIQRSGEGQEHSSQVRLAYPHEGNEYGLPTIKEIAEKSDAEISGFIRTHEEHERQLYFPGPIRIVESLKKRFMYRTIPEIGTDHETVYYFNGEIYERAEEQIKSESHEEFIRQWTEMLKLAGHDSDKKLILKLHNSLDRGPSMNDINEVLAMIRRTTFTYDELNPDGYIPFLNGLLNLKTKKLEPFNDALFYTYQIKATLLHDRYVTLRDTPLFAGLLNTAFYEPDIPMILSYFAYTLYPDLPVHRVLFVLGRERIGKGTSVRVLQGLMPKGSGSVSLARLLTSERFQFTGIEGKNLLVDSETKRKFRKGTVLEWSAFCNLFGKDVLSVEPKGHDAHDYISKSKGIMLGNLPFLNVDSPPAIARMLIIITRSERPGKIIPDLDKKILDSERDMIATLLVQILFKLIENDFEFPGQLTDDATANLVEQLSDPVENFIDEETEYNEGKTVTVETAFKKFTTWCGSKGIPVIARQTFVKKFGWTYKKHKGGTRGNREYVFMNCAWVNNDSQDDDPQERLEVGHGVNPQETLKISVSGERYRRVQHGNRSLRVALKVKSHDHEHDHVNTCIKVSAPKLDTGVIDAGKPEIQGPADIDPVSNLHDDLKNYKTYPQNRDTPKNNSKIQNYDTPVSKNENEDQDEGITMENGNMIRDQLLALGYLISPDSGLDLSQKFFKIGIMAISRLSDDKKTKLENIMESEKFQVRNDGALGITWFSRPLKKEGEKP